MFGTSENAPSKKALLTVIAVLLLFIAGGVLAYLLMMDQYLRDTAKAVGEIQARVQAIEDQQKRDESDIDDLYGQIDELNGYGPTDGSGTPQGSHT